jgi:LAGLIDADG endonuclease
LLESLGNVTLPATRTVIFYLSRPGENVLTADNQQERLDPRWVSGFVDGEGCFHVSINKVPSMSQGWQVLPEFRIVQHSRDEAILHRLRDFFGCGRVVLNRGTQKELRIRRLNDLKRVVEFFSETQLQSKKRRDFDIFRDIIDTMTKRQHLTDEGIAKIEMMAWKMNRQVKPRYLESSETLRRKPRIGG